MAAIDGERTPFPGRRPDFGPVYGGEAGSRPLRLGTGSSPSAGG